MDRGAWRATRSPWGCKELDTTEATWHTCTSVKEVSFFSSAFLSSRRDSGVTVEVIIHERRSQEPQLPLNGFWPRQVLDDLTFGYLRVWGTQKAVLETQLEVLIPSKQ